MFVPVFEQDFAVSREVVLLQGRGGQEGFRVEQAC